MTKRQSQRFRLHIREKDTGHLLSNQVWHWQMIPGAAVSIEKRLYRVLAITPHPKLKTVQIVWVRDDKDREPDDT